MVGLLSSDGHRGPRAFPAFPYEPYPIQQDFMQALYETIDAGQIGLFESPTGTGKTLSLICSSLQWLEDRHALEAAEAQASKSSAAASQKEDDMPAWMLEDNQQQDQQAHQAQRLRKAKARAKTTLFGSSRHSPRKPPTGAKGLARAHARPPGAVAPDTGGLSTEDTEFLLDAWDSDFEDAAAKRKPSRMEESSSEDSETDEENEEAAPKKRQIFFCSRTHSQLSQFVSELHHTPFAETLSVVAIAGRKALCINDAVLKLGSATRINERCLELQTAKASKRAAAAGTAQDKPSAKKAASSGCPFRKANKSSMRHLKDAVLALPMDVEDLGKLGRRKEVCPYYAARAAVPQADLVLLPYAALLLQETRASLGINLEDSVVIVDEGHNLVDAVNAVHSAVIFRGQLATAKLALDTYFTRFSSRLAPGNSKHIQSLIALATVLHDCLEQDKSSTPAAAQILTVNNFLFSKGLDNLNLFRLIRYVRDSKAVQRISGYADSSAGMNVPDEQSRPSDGTGSGMASMHALVSLASALNNADADGRVVIDVAGGSLKFLLLNAAAHFAKVLAPARSVILASGTLAPIASLQQQLFPHVPPERMRLFSCGHVVPKERLLAVALGRGPTGAALDLRHVHRGKSAMLDEMGRVLINTCQAVPQGVVVFFPSFSYADEVYEHWQASGALRSLSNKKHVFREPRSAVEVESVLKQYSKAIEQHSEAGGSSAQNGALLMCVVGGKMSEGINFGDGLGRCVVVMGMPFPNPTDPELCERMRYLDASANHPADPLQPEGASHSSGVAPMAGREYFEDLCMKAVNQCIGRVIRHRGDWAAILLVDQRWAPDQSQGGSGPLKKLPGWIQESLVIAGSFGEAFGRLHKFARSLQKSMHS